MGIPIKGRVVVVDDKINEDAAPLVQALSQIGISSFFYTGRRSSLPDNPLGGVRLLFLDLKLEGIDFSLDDDGIAKALQPVVEKIIGSDNGPYILLGWTTSPRDNKILSNLEKIVTLRPTLRLDMEKQTCFSDNVCDIAKIKQKLIEKLPQIGHLQTLFCWESLVNESAYTTINQIFKDVASVGSILHKIAKANLDANFDTASKEQKIRGNFQVFNRLLSDSIDRNMNNFDFTQCEDLSNGSTCTEDMITQINTKLHVLEEVNEITILQTGNLYFVADANGIIDAIIKYNAKDNKEEIKRSNPQLVELDITPSCDYAQCHIEHVRLLPGILVNAEYKDNFKNRDSNYHLCPPFNINGQKKYLLFDYRFFNSLPKAQVESRTSKPKHRIRHELLVDIQAGLSAHINRPGIVSVK
jgi:hypothetical protein